MAALVVPAVMVVLFVSVVMAIVLAGEGGWFYVGLVPGGDGSGCCGKLHVNVNNRVQHNYHHLCASLLFFPVFFFFVVDFIV